MDLKPGPLPGRRARGDLGTPEERDAIETEGTEGSMRGLGMVLLTGAAAVVVWKILAALVTGLLGLLFKVALVLLLLYVLLQIVNGHKNRE
jgi:hypothetical protein